MTKDESTQHEIVPTLKALAVALGTSPRSVGRWRADGAPGRGPTGYSVPQWRRWVDTHIPATGRASPDESGGDRERLLRAQADERQAKAALADLRLKIERGEYRLLSDIETWDRSRIAIVRRGLLGLGRQVAPLVVGLTTGEIEAVVSRECRSLLMRFAAIEK